MQHQRNELFGLLLHRQTARCPIYNTGSVYHCGCYCEVGEDGVVDQVVLLNVPEALKSFWFNDRLREHLRLRYADPRRHRVVVFGLLRADARGHLMLAKSKVLLPKCCCTGRRCA